MNAIVPFQFDDKAVRVVERDGQPWFVLADVCAILGLKNPTMAAKPLDDTERAKLNLGGEILTIVSLPGLLTLMLRCRGAMKPDTVPYRLRKFITADVMPSVLRTGSYAAPEPMALPRDPRALLAYLAQQAGDMVDLQDSVAALEPKAAALDRLAEAEGLLCLSDAAKALAVPPRRFFAWVEAHGWIFKRSDKGPWVAFEAKRQSGMLIHKGKYVEVRGRPDKWVEQVMVTPKGLARLAEKGAGR